MSLKFELSELAHADLESIWNYTVLNWSPNQANKYYKEIFTQIEKICENPMIGRSIKLIKNNIERLMFRRTC